MQGQYEDSETGLYYNRYRYFDPNISAYISQDPIRLNAGTNLYFYGLNSVMWIDPLGLECDGIGTYESQKGHHPMAKMELMGMTRIKHSQLVKQN